MAGSARGARGRRPPAPAASSAPPLARAKAIALRQLASCARTEAQIRARLERAELSAEADEVVRWLLGLGYLDDRAYARGRARALVGAGRAGPRLVERRLVTAGIDRAAARGAVSAAFAEAAEEGGELGLCRALAQRRAGTAELGRLDPRARARLARFLAGRGFAGSVVARVLGMYEDG